MQNITDYRILFLYDCQSDDALLSGGSWQMPLANLQNKRLEHIARSNGVSPANTQFKVSLARIVDLAGIYIGWTNLGKEALVRARIWPTSSFSGVPTFDTGWKGDLIPDDDDLDRGPSLYLLFDESHQARYITVEIDDHLNPIGHIDLGRLIIGRYVKPSFNYTYDGNSFNFSSRAIVSSTLSGGETVWDRAEPRTFSMSFRALPEIELFNDFYRMMRVIKRGGEVVVIPRPDADALEMQRRSFLGSAVNRNGILQSLFQRGDVSLEIQEKMGLAPLAVIGATVGVPVDQLAARDHAPEIGVSTIIDIPAELVEALDFAPGIHGGAAILLPSDHGEAQDYAAFVGSGEIVEFATDDANVMDFAPTIALGAGIAVPSDDIEAAEFSPMIISGTAISLPADGAVVRDFVPLIGNAVVVQVPLNDAEVRDFAPAARVGTAVALPIDDAEAEDFVPVASAGSAIAIPDDSSVVTNYPVRIPAFDAGFDAGFA